MNTKNAFINFGIMFLSFTFMAGCEDNSKLSRSKAEKMIIEKLAYPLHYGVGIPSMDGYIRIYTPDTEHREDNINNVFSKLQAADLITYNLLSTVRHPMANDYILTVNLLDKSKKYVLQDWKSQGNDIFNSGPFSLHIKGNNLTFGGTGVVIHTCDLVFQKITGISFINNLGPQMAIVQFTDMFSNPTPFSALSDDLCGEQIGKIRERKITFQLYDDGWRIED